MIFFVLLCAVVSANAQVHSLIEPQRDVACPNEVTTLTCSVSTAAIQWIIPAFGVDISFGGGDSVGNTKTPGPFTAKLLSQSPTNSTLSFIGNSTLNGVVIECRDTGVVGHVTNLTLNFTDAGINAYSIYSTTKLYIL